MTDDIRLIGDGEIRFVDIEASADTGCKPRISMNLAYRGGKLDVAGRAPGNGRTSASCRLGVIKCPFRNIRRSLANDMPCQKGIRETHSILNIKHLIITVK